MTKYLNFEEIAKLISAEADNSERAACSRDLAFALVQVELAITTSAEGYCYITAEKNSKFCDSAALAHVRTAIEYLGKAEEFLRTEINK